MQNPLLIRTRADLDLALENESQTLKGYYPAIPVHYLLDRLRAAWQVLQGRALVMVCEPGPNDKGWR